MRKVGFFVLSMIFVSFLSANRPLYGADACSPFGINAQPNLPDYFPQDSPHYNENWAPLDSMKSAGIGWLRLLVSWQDIDTAESCFRNHSYNFTW